MAIHNVISTLGSGGREVMGPEVPLCHHPGSDISNASWAVSVASTRPRYLPSADRSLGISRLRQSPRAHFMRSSHNAAATASRSAHAWRSANSHSRVTNDGGTDGRPVSAHQAR